MKVVVFGATGKIGSRVVNKLIENQHTVTAFVHSEQSNLGTETVRGDVKNKQDVEKAISGQDAVISCLGSWGTDTKDILSEGMKNIIPAMEKNGVKKIVSLTGADAFLPAEQLSSFQKVIRLILKLVAKPILVDGEKHLRLLADSGLDWVVIRSPVMVSKSDNGYALDTKQRLIRKPVSRDSVCSAMVNQLTQDTWNGKAPFIVNKK